jgi:hypothetical protein
MTGDEGSSFTSRINGLLPLDNAENVAKLIRVVARQIKKSVFRFNLDKLEVDLQDWTSQEFKPQLTVFFNRARTNLKEGERSIKHEAKTAQGSNNQKKKPESHIKKKKLSPSKSLPKVQGVPESLIRKSIKNEEKRKKRSLKKKEVMKSGPPQRAWWNQERIVIGIYTPRTLSSETEEDPIHRK